MIVVISRNFVKTELHFSTLNLMKLRLSTCQYNSSAMRLQMALWIYYGLFHLCKFQWKCTIDYGGLDAHIIRTIGWCGWNWLYSTHWEKYAAAAGAYFGSKASPLSTYSTPNLNLPFWKRFKSHWNWGGDFGFFKAKIVTILKRISKLSVGCTHLVAFCIFGENLVCCCLFYILWFLIWWIWQARDFWSWILECSIKKKKDLPIDRKRLCQQS